MEEDFLKELEEKLNETLFIYKGNINRIRAEGASPTLLDNVHVNYYGTELPLNQVSNILSEEGKYLIVIPYDKSLLKEIATSVTRAAYDFSVNVENEKIRIFVPPLTEEKRKIFVKRAKEVSEEAKIHVRNLRHHIIKKVENKFSSEDDIRFYKDSIEEKIQQANHTIDEALHEKTQNLMKV